jgi:hypothetical protein
MAGESIADFQSNTHSIAKQDGFKSPSTSLRVITLFSEAQFS